MFKDMSAVFATMGANKEEQLLLFKAVNQMFSLGRIQAEEMNQLTGQGLVPRQAVYQAIRDTYGKNLSNQDIAKLQKANKLDPSLIVPKLFKSLYEQADKSGALAKYKNSSQFRQGQLLESLNQLSKELMDSGLDSFLAVIFHLLDGIVKSLTQLVKELKPAVAAIKEISSTMSGWYKALNNVTGGNNILIGVLLLLVGRYKHVARVGGIVVTMLQNGTRWSRIFSTVLTGTFGSALGKIIGKFTVWGLLIWGVSKALKFVYEQMEMSKQGKWTFFDEIFAMTELAILKLKNLGLAMTLAVTQALNFAVNPVLSSTGNTLMGHITGTTYNPYAKVTPPDQKSRLLSSGSDKGSGGYLGIGGFGVNNRQPVSVDAIPRQSSMNKYVVLKANQIQIDAKDSKTILNDVATNPIRTISAMTP